jgi:hypothetical protein
VQHTGGATEQQHRERAFVALASDGCWHAQ